MKIKFFILGICCMSFALNGCASWKKIMQPTAQVEPITGVQGLGPYSGPKARIAVAEFEVKAVKANGEIGSGLREMLISALINSNRFSVVERKTLEAVTKEQESSDPGAMEQASKAQTGKARIANLIIAAAVTEFQPQASGGRAGVGGGGGVGSGVLGALSGGSLNKALMALDVRVIDTSTSGVITTSRVLGQASDIGGAVMDGFSGGRGLGGGLSAYANTPMEKAIRICIIETVKYIAQAAPASYYKY